MVEAISTYIPDLPLPDIEDQPASLQRTGRNQVRHRPSIHREFNQNSDPISGRNVTINLTDVPSVTEAPVSASTVATKFPLYAKIAILAAVITVVAGGAIGTGEEQQLQHRQPVLVLQQQQPQQLRQQLQQLPPLPLLLVQVQLRQLPRQQLLPHPQLLQVQLQQLLPPARVVQLVQLLHRQLPLLPAPPVQPLLVPRLLRVLRQPPRRQQLPPPQAPPPALVAQHQPPQQRAQQLLLQVPQVQPLLLVPLPPVRPHPQRQLVQQVLVQLVQQPQVQLVQQPQVQQVQLPQVQQVLVLLLQRAQLPPLVLLLRLQEQQAPLLALPPPRRLLLVLLVHQPLVLLVRLLLVQLPQLQEQQAPPQVLPQPRRLLPLPLLLVLLVRLLLVQLLRLQEQQAQLLVLLLPQPLLLVLLVHQPLVLLVRLPQLPEQQAPLLVLPQPRQVLLLHQLLVQQPQVRLPQLHAQQVLRALPVVQLRRQQPPHQQQQLEQQLQQLQLPQLQPQLVQLLVKQQLQVTSAPCPTGYVRTPSGSCVNLLIDFNNCGSIGYVCASTYTSCSNGACSGAPAVLLVGGVTPSGWGGTANVDDAYVTLTAPFAISMYGYSTTTPSVQSNGCVCLGGCSSAYSNTAIPATGSGFTGPTAFGFWDDLYIYSGTSQSVYYGTTGTYPNRALVFEFYMAHYGVPTQYYHFQIVFYENAPNIVRYYYYQASDGGASATIGTQNNGGTVYKQYSYNSAVVPAGSSTTTTATLILTFDTTANTVTSAAG